MWRSIQDTFRRSGSRLSASGLALLLALSSGVGRSDEPLILAVNINGVDHDEIITARWLSDGTLAVPERDLRTWDMRLPVTGRVLIDGLVYVRLADLPEIEYRVDNDSQSLRLTVPAKVFNARALSLGLEKDMALTPTQPGGFLNYDLNWQRQEGIDSGGGLAEIGYFNTWGSGTATGLWDADKDRWLRLDTTWNVDMPDQMQSLRFGDAIGVPGSWGRAVRFGGLQWATNFATRPGFITFPLPNLRGEATLPSTLDVYLDNARVAHDQVQAGPFDLTNVPVITGQGELRMVVNDLLGRQQVISQAYYAAPRLLRPGLRDFAYEVGAVREDYGMASNRYGRGMLAATERLGITPNFTREWRAEVLAHQQALGLGGVWLMPRLGDVYLGTVNFAAALSHAEAGYGHMVALGAEHQSYGLNVGFQVQRADRRFTQLGQAPDSTPRLTVQASMGISLGGHGFGLGYARQNTWQGDDRRLLSASYSLSLGRAGQVGLYALRDLSGNGDYSVSLLWALPLDSETSVNANITDQSGHNLTTVQLQHNTPSNTGIGYRLLVGADQRYQAGATVQTERATFNLEAASLDGRTGYRAGASGGVAVAGGGVFPSRRIDGSFAIVKVADFAGVRVYRDNQEVARTNERGLAMITQLRAYQKNPVAIEQADLPMDAEVDTLQLKLTPALRSGVVAEFPVRRGHQASLRLVDATGQAVPPGVLVRLEGEAREFPVGFDGQVFLTGVGPHARLQAEWEGHRCQVELSLAQDVGPMPNLGTLICHGGTP